MYCDRLRKRSDINASITHLFSGSYPNKYANAHTTFFENLQKELDARKTKQAIKQQTNKHNKLPEEISQEHKTRKRRNKVANKQTK